MKSRKRLTVGDDANTAPCQEIKDTDRYDRLLRPIRRLSIY